MKGAISYFSEDDEGGRARVTTYEERGSRTGGGLELEGIS